MFHLYAGCYTRHFHFHSNTGLAWHRNTTIKLTTTMKDDNAYCCSQDKVNFFRLDELRFCIPLDTKQVISNMFFLANHLATTTVLRPFFRDHPGEPVQKRTSRLVVQGKINRGRHTDHPAGRHSIRTNQCPPPPSPIFYRPDALPAAQPTVSKH